MVQVKLICIIFSSLFFGNAGQSFLFGQLDSTNIPLFVIDTDGKPIFDEPKISADLKIIYQENSYHQIDDPGNIYSGKIGIEIRGKYSASLPQKPYGFETRDEAGNNRNTPLFHLPEENDWILLANYNDKTFLRNALSFELFRKIGGFIPVPDHRFLSRRSLALRFPGELQGFIINRIKILMV